LTDTDTDAWNVYLVEEDLRYVRNGNGKKFANVDFFGNSFNNGQTVGETTVQLLENKVCWVGSATYTQNKKLNRICKECTLEVARLLGLNKCGGFDFCVQVHNQNQNQNQNQDPRFQFQFRIYLIDMNVGRNTASEISHRVASRFGIDEQKCVILRKQLKIKNPDMRFSQVLDYNWNVMKGQLLFSLTDEKRKSADFGIFVHVFLPLPKYCCLSVFASSAQKCTQLLNVFETLVSK
jgi:hypothetical protein